MNLVLKILFLFAVFATVLSRRPTKHNGGHISQVDKIWRNKKSDCLSTTCSRIAFHEGYNCVNECVSSKCYNSIYASSPLEDGEIDAMRERDFVRCVRLEQKENNLMAGVTAGLSHVGQFS